MLKCMRSNILQLEETEHFEQMLLRGSQAGLERRPTTTDIDVLMRGMMVSPQNTTIAPRRNAASTTEDSGL